MAVRTINEFPAAWLAPPALKSVEGRSQGVMCYKVTLKLMKLTDTSLSDSNAPLMNDLQQDALCIVDTLREQDDVCDITAVKCTPLTGPQTPSRDVSLCVEMDLHAYFNRVRS